jgi:hypothetical protein
MCRLLFYLLNPYVIMFCVFFVLLSPASTIFLRDGAQKSGSRFAWFNCACSNVFTAQLVCMCLVQEYPRHIFVN